MKPKLKNRIEKKEVKAWATTHKGIITNFGNRLDIYSTREGARFNADSNGFKVAKITISYTLPLTKRTKK
ncbi:hypothetical protein M0R04_14020 [Candidatus Dojkabacteria bacterium]|jgi:hypothetical protein|nr:hypothetical protein [Candidatus Dojkabacteria bacterium]